jgi:predicted nuclease of predicted toxin-antitoxin system
VKLLFDANVSHKLVRILAHEFPGSVHVRDVGRRAAEDSQIWDHARTQGLMIVSKGHGLPRAELCRRIPAQDHLA